MAKLAPGNRWNIEILSHARGYSLRRPAIRSLLQSIASDIAERLHIEAAGTISVLFTNDREIHELNRTFRHKDKPTDVLSFPGSKKPLVGTDHLGDLAISLETTATQAKRYRVTFSQELARLLIHGTLHLFGYDHEGVPAAEAQKMRRFERRLRERYAAESRRLERRAPPGLKKRHTSSRAACLSVAKRRRKPGAPGLPKDIR